MTVSKFISDKVIVRTNNYKYVRPLWDLLHPNRNHIKFSKMLYKEDSESSWDLSLRFGGNAPEYDSGWYLPGDISGANVNTAIEKLLKVKFFGAYVIDSNAAELCKELEIGLYLPTKDYMTLWRRKSGACYIQRGVNSGHLTPNDKGTKEPLWYRSRGLFVLPEWRKKGLGQLLLQRTIEEAIDKGCSHIWSYPNESAISVYLNVGFTQESDFQEAEYGQNCYVLCKL